MLLAILAIFSLTALMIPHLFVRGFLRRQAPVLAPAQYPDVSILKAIKGADDDMYNNFRSHLTQDYPGQVQLIFALEDSLEPAVPHIERLMQEFPKADIQLVYSGPNPGILGQIHNFMRGEREIKHDIVVLADSDVNMEDPHSLRELCGPFGDPKIGLTATVPLFCQMENVWAALTGILYNLNTVATSAMLEQFGVSTATGSFMAFRRDILPRIGGFKSLGRILGHDAALVREVEKAGFDIYLSPMPCKVRLQRNSFMGWYHHAKRWAINYVVSFRGAFAVFGLAFGLLFATVYWALHPGEVFAQWLLAAAWGSRALSAVLSWSYMREPSTLRWLWLFPIIEMVVAPFLWVLATCSRTVLWRGVWYQVHSDGTITNIEGRTFWQSLKALLLFAR